MDVTGVMSRDAPHPDEHADRRAGPVDPAEETGTEPAGLPTPAERPLATVAGAVWRGLGYAARTVGVPAGVRGLAVEIAWTAVHVSLYPWGLVDEVLRPAGTFVHHRTAALSTAQRSLVVSDMETSTTPVLLVHGIVDNRSIFALLSRALRRRGFGVVHAVNFSVLTAFTGDVRAAARELGHHVERLCASTGADRVHIVGHSLGGLMARYYVQRLGGDARVDTLVTLGTPHRGSLIAHFLPPTRVPQQLQPGSDLLRELEEPAPGCRTRFLAVWSRQDQLIVPQSAARLTHPDLAVTEVELEHVGHLSMTIDPEVVHLVTRLLSRRPVPGRRERAGSPHAVAG
ncbi:esterase/lipase family protein [Actinomycetospora lemnae]|uniref:Alpha/beta fold hydrolase n=1 Tax=Actinomycetospora lemnae TaxID=3019891 RepID=A0ABT5SUW4_9PSEU|nr:alpha/beta fold hydrolase [Actinomycetospora sp. DW7H6]MDD7966645.1 alpha/beta fold hydrolase [Actinomycetospora sp. DW7H6]